MVNYTRYDVAVIGGGLAGLSMAIQCAAAGYATALFEKESYPFHKVCGEYISNESAPFLSRLGIPLSRYELPQINTLHLTDAAGTLYQFPLHLGGFGISRYLLDHLLYTRALELGVTVYTNTKVQDIVRCGTSFNLETDKGTFGAQIACGAWGKRSNLDVKWKRPFALLKGDKQSSYIGIKYHVAYPQPEAVIGLYNFEDGYCGISRIEGDTCCLCYLTTAANLRRCGNSIARMEEAVLWQNPVLKHIFTKAQFLYKEPLAISQVSFKPKASAENGVLMLGDAAGLITPLCGNGMSMAMHAAALAFKQVDACLQRAITPAQMEARYRQQWQKAFGTRLQAGRLIQRAFGGRGTTAVFLRSMQLFPPIARALIRLTHGRTF